MKWIIVIVIFVVIIFSVGSSLIYGIKYKKRSKKKSNIKHVLAKNDIDDKKIKLTMPVLKVEEVKVKLNQVPSLFGNDNEQEIKAHNKQKVNNLVDSLDVNIDVKNKKQSLKKLSDIQIQRNKDEEDLNKHLQSEIIPSKKVKTKETSLRPSMQELEKEREIKEERIRKRLESGQRPVEERNFYEDNPFAYYGSAEEYYNEKNEEDQKIPSEADIEIFEDYNIDDYYEDPYNDPYYEASQNAKYKLKEYDPVLINRNAYDQVNKNKITYKMAKKKIPAHKMNKKIRKVPTHKMKKKIRKVPKHKRDRKKYQAYKEDIKKRSIYLDKYGNEIKFNINNKAIIRRSNKQNRYPRTTGYYTKKKLYKNKEGDPVYFDSIGNEILYTEDKDSDGNTIKKDDQGNKIYKKDKYIFHMMNDKGISIYKDNKGKLVYLKPDTKTYYINPNDEYYKLSYIDKDGIEVFRNKFGQHFTMNNKGDFIPGVTTETYWRNKNLYKKRKNLQNKPEVGIKLGQYLHLE